MSSRTRYIAYVDETGTNELDSSKPGVSNLFICTAILVKESDNDTLSAELAQMSHDLCSGAEIKSSRIGNKHKRRMLFLDRIKKLDFKYYALIINKDHVYKDSGLQYKASYYKFINQMLYDRIANEYSDLHVIADTIGGQEYMASFEQYLKGKMPNLLSNFSHSFGDSASTPLLQLADLISGTLSFCFMAEKKGEHSEQFRAILRPKELRIETWPPVRQQVAQPSDSPFHSSDLFQSTKNRAIEFIERMRPSSDEYCRMQADVVHKLLFHQLFDCADDGCLSSSKLRSYLRDLGYEKLSEPTFRSRIIGKIRDEGVILSGTSRGYRLAVCEQDIHDYLEHNRNIIEPMLSRLRRAQTVIKADIGTDADILDSQEFEILRAIVDRYTDISLEISTRKPAQPEDAAAAG